MKYTSTLTAACLTSAVLVSSHPIAKLDARGYNDVDVRNIFSHIESGAKGLWHADGGSKGFASAVGSVATNYRNSRRKLDSSEVHLALRDLEAELIARDYDDIEARGKILSAIGHGLKKSYHAVGGAKGIASAVGGLASNYGNSRRGFDFSEEEVDLALRDLEAALIARGYDDIEARGKFLSSLGKDLKGAYHAVGGASGIIKGVGKVASHFLRSEENLDLALRGYDMDNVQVFERDVDDEMLDAREFDEELEMRGFEVDELD